MGAGARRVHAAAGTRGAARLRAGAREPLRGEACRAAAAAGGADAPARVGNDRAVLAGAGWLFYQPGIDYVTGPGFLDDGLLRLRANAHARSRPGGRRATGSPAGAPRAARGPRACWHPAGARAGPRQGGGRGTAAVAGRGRCNLPANPDWPRFAAEMRAAGLDVFDGAAPAGRRPAFLPQDTHWAPQYMRQVAEALHARSRRAAAPCT